MAEKQVNVEHHTGPVFAYVTDIDPAMTTFGWKIIGLAHVALLAPFLGAFLPRESATNWSFVALSGVFVLLLGGVNLFHFRRMIRSDGYRAPAPIVLLCEIILATVATGIAGHALGGHTGMYRPLIFVPTLLISMIGNRWMILVSWVAAMIVLFLTITANGTVHEALAALMFSYAIVWGIIAIMVHLLAVASLHSDNQMLGLTQVTSIAAQANSLSEGIEQVLPVITKWANARRAGAYYLARSPGETGGISRPDAIFVWPAGATMVPPTTLELAAAREHRGIDVSRRRSVLIAEGGEFDDLVAIVLDDVAQPKYDRLMTQFNLERMAMQIGMLVGRTRYVARLEDLGRTDALTSLPNRRELMERIEQARVEARRRGDALSVVMIDLDHFKDFNDAYGHQSGDELLRCFGNELRHRLRAVDFVGRYGGEEFLMVLPDTDSKGAYALLTKLQQGFRELACLHGVTFSAGISEWDFNEGAEALIGRADRALYAAKDAGRDRIVSDRVNQ